MFQKGKRVVRLTATNLHLVAPPERRKTNQKKCYNDHLSIRQKKFVVPGSKQLLVAVKLETELQRVKCLVDLRHTEQLRSEPRNTQVTSVMF